MRWKIKDWKKFQHYGDNRRPVWIKLYRDLIDDINWHMLDPLAAKCLVGMWIVASENNGVLPDIKTLAFRLRVSEAQLKSLFSQLVPFLEQDASSVLASGYQVASLEEEREEEKEEEIDTELRGARTARSQKKGSRLPPDWVPVDHVSETYELEKFRDYWASVPGQKGVKLDWDATWRNWIKNARERRPARRETLAEQIARTSQEILNEHQGRDARGGDSFGFLSFREPGED